MPTYDSCSSQKCPEDEILVHGKKSAGYTEEPDGEEREGCTNEYSFMMSLLYIRKLRLREVQSLALGHKAQFKQRSIFSKM